VCLIGRIVFLAHVDPVILSFADFSRIFPPHHFAQFKTSSRPIISHPLGLTRLAIHDILQVNEVLFGVKDICPGLLIYVDPFAGYHLLDAPLLSYDSRDAPCVVLTSQFEPGQLIRFWIYFIDTVGG
jgi:hypothetical protein